MAKKKTAKKEEPATADDEIVDEYDATRYTPWIPGNMPVGGKSNSTEQLNDHPTEHNHAAEAISDIVDRFADLRLYVPAANSCGVDGQLHVTGQVLTANGAAALPAYSFNNGPDTGMYTLDGTDVGLTAGGGLALRAHPSYIYSYKPNIGVNGSLGQPTYSFQSDTDTGMFRYAEDQIAFALGGQLSAIHQLGATYLYKPQRAQNGTMTEPTYGFQYDLDTGMGRGIDGDGNVQPDTIQLVVGGERAAFFGKSGGTDPGVWMPSINDRTNTAGARPIYVSSKALGGPLSVGNATRENMREVEAVNLDASHSVYDLEPIWYRMANAEGKDLGRSFYGLVAEDVAEVDPRLAYYGYDDDGSNERPEDVNTNAITALLVSVVKEQRATISDLTARVEALEANA